MKREGLNLRTYNVKKDKKQVIEQLNHYNCEISEHKISKKVSENHNNCYSENFMKPNDFEYLNHNN